MAAIEASRELQSAFGVRPLCLERWLVEPGDVPYDDADLEKVLAALLPRKLVRIRESADDPGGPMERVEAAFLRPDFAFDGMLERVLTERNLHVQPLHLEWLGGPHLDFAQRFGALVRDCSGAAEVTVQAGFFISSPGSIVRLHVDGSHNFLIHLKGTKQVHAFPADDVRVSDEPIRERMYSGGNRYLAYRPDFESTAFVADLERGMSCYLPPLWPHWVLGGPEISTSLAVSITTPFEDRRQRIYAFNHRLRSAGLRPRPVGASPRLDSVKQAVEGTIEAALRGLRRAAKSLR